MPRVKLNASLNRLNDELNQNLNLATDAVNFKELKNGNYLPILKSRVNLVIELSFLRIFISWEEFLSDTFLRYMCGARTNSGFSPTRYVKPSTLDHAFDMMRVTRSYVDWSKYDEIIAYSKLYFERGEPFALSLGGALTQLEEMKCVRNRIAHSSKICEEKFSELVRQRFGHYVHNMSPGKFLQYKIPPTNPRTLLQEYVDLLKATSRLIIP